eukprot:9491791-Pyramimonas_sp.AAC.4
MFHVYIFFLREALRKAQVYEILQPHGAQFVVTVTRGTYEQPWFVALVEPPPRRSRPDLLALRRWKSAPSLTYPYV